MIRLERSLLRRLLCGSWLQALFVTVGVLLVVRAVGQLAGSVHDSSLPLGATLLVIVALAGAVAVGATGWAVADDAGIRWRYYLPHQYAWSEIEQISLDFRTVGIAAWRQPVVVRVRGRSHRITPAEGGGAGRKAFGRRLVEAASARGIPAEDHWV